MKNFPEKNANDKISERFGESVLFSGFINSIYASFEKFLCNKIVKKSSQETRI